jgi:hypothetical protein
MRSLIIPLASAVVLLGSCSVYRSAQTPDDVYYSPSRVERSAATGGDQYTQADNGRDDGRRYQSSPTYNGYDDYATSEDRWLMMRVRDRARWSVFDDYYYSPYSSPYYYNPYGFAGVAPGFSLGLGFGLTNWLGGGYYSPYSYPFYDPYMNYYGWNSYYNPYYKNIVVVNPKVNPAGYTTMRNFNVSRYSNSNVNNRPALNNRQNYNYRPRYNNVNTNSRRVYSNSSTLENSRQRPSYNPSQERPVRSYSPSNNSSYSPSSSGGGNSGGGGGSRPSRR